MNTEEQTWEWLAEFAEHVRRRDIDAGAALFDPACVSFGTRAGRVANRTELVAQQWTPIWFSTEDFAFDRSSLVVQPSSSGDQRVAIVSWTSVGVSPEGTRFDRHGRATIVLRKSRGSGRLQATHSHFSETPDSP